MRLRWILTLGVALGRVAYRAGAPPPQTPATPSRLEVRTATSVGKEIPRVKEHRSSDWSPGLAEEEKETLMTIAEDTLRWVVEQGGRGFFPFTPYTLTPKLKEKCATFVTFKNRGELRGCVGCLEAMEPMYESVHRSAFNAARDSRFFFNPIRREELPDIDIHVSLLSPSREIASLEEFKIGEHGIWMIKGMARAVYLPEVAVEQKWTKEQTLSSLAQKAGLPGDAWREGARFMIFSSVVLSRE